MMMFRTVKAAIIQLLGDEAAGLFSVIGYRGQSHAASEIKDKSRTVQVYYSEGQFPRNAGRMASGKIHDLTIDLDLSASAAAKGDVSALTSPDSTAQAKALALSELRSAADVADTSIDELIEAVYQIMMDARNIDLGLSGEVASRWIETIRKDTALEHGDLVVKTASMKFTCRVCETVRGDLGYQPATVTISADTHMDNASQTGISVENDNA